MPISVIDSRLERGVIHKKWKGKLPIALLFPNVYELAMSNLGMQLVYTLVGGRDEMVCERVFLPQARGMPRSVESNRPLKDFPIIMTAISFEHDYLNLLRMLRLANITPLANDRPSATIAAGEPLVIAGGVATFINPEPLAPFIDLFWVGEAEAGLLELLQSLIQEGGGALPGRRDFLQDAAARAGCYVPGFSQYRYDDSQHYAGLQKTGPGSLPVAKVICPEMTEAGHSTLLTPQTEFSDLFLVELGRGCSRGCRFCAAGFVYRPPRLWKTGAILAAMAARPDSCQRLGLLGMEMAKPHELAAVAAEIEQQHCALSFSSLRADALSPQLISLLGKSRLKTAAIAPDGASQRLRQVINKGLAEEDILMAARQLVGAGVVNLKLYFMIGLPTEDEDDLVEMISLVAKVKETIDVIGRERGRLASIMVSLNSFVPKAWTPFQYVPFAGVRILKKRIKIIRQALGKMANVRVKVDKPDTAFFQAVLARGDRRLAPALLAMVDSGRNWRQVMADQGLDPELFSGGRGEDEPLPWQVIDHGINDHYLWQEYQKSLVAKATIPCDPAVCRRCGVCGD